MKRFFEMASRVGLWLFAVILLIFSIHFGLNLFSVFSAVSALNPFREPPPSLPHLELEKIVSAYVAILVPFLFLVQIADKLVEKTNEASALARASLIAISSLVAISFIAVPQVASTNLASVADFLSTLAVVIILVSPYFWSVCRIIELILKYESKES